MNKPLSVHPARRAQAQAVWDALQGARTVALSTHVNADGDGCGSQGALALILRGLGVEAWIVNPTPWPQLFAFLLEPGVRDRTADGAPAITEADRVVVLDINDIRRLGALAPALRAHPATPVVIDHHLPGDEPVGGVALADTTACATGELVYDFAVSLDCTITPEIATALYTAILTDTGGFRYSNTSPRCHEIAADLLRCGVDPEAMYRRIYASVPPGRLWLLRDALDTLEIDQEAGIAWLDIPVGSVERYALSSEDLDGIAEHPRSIAGVSLAVVFRDLGYGKVKVSFRSMGEVDVNALARRFGGGGHARASGALIAGELDVVRSAVLAAARDMLGARLQA